MPLINIKLPEGKTLVEILTTNYQVKKSVANQKLNFDKFRDVKKP